MGKKNQVELKKKYGLSVAITMVMGIVIGIGIFFKAEAILKASSLNPKVAILAWTLGGVITILAGLTVSEVGAAIPKTGGLVVYIKKIYGDFAGFLTGWMHVVLYLPGLIAVLAYYTGFFATIFLGIENSTLNIAVISISLLISVFAINLFLPKSGGRLQTFITVVKILPLLGLLIFGFLKGGNTTPFMINTTVAEPMSLKLVVTALVPVMFAYDGWILVCSIGGEVREPNKNIPRAIIIGLGLITVLYVGLNIALLKTLPADVLVKQGTVGAANILFGPFGTKIIFGGIIISAYGTLNGLSLAGIRFPYILAIDGQFPMKETFKKINKKYDTPINSGLLIVAISSIYLAISLVSDIEVDVFANVPIATVWAFYSVLFLGLIVLRRREPDLERPYLVPLYPLIPILAAIGGIGITISAVINSPFHMLYSLAVILLGVPFYKKG